MPEGFDLASQCRQIGYDTDRVKLVGSREGFWHHLLIKGYRNIKLLVAQTDQKCLQPLHPLVRLSG